jgi:hypothetical protein
VRARFKQATDLGLADFSGAYNQALLAFQFQKYWK